MAAPSAVQELTQALVAALRETTAVGKKSYASNFQDFAYGEKHDVTGTPISIGYSHGPGGSLSYPGVDPAVFHTIVGNKGLLGQLATMPSLYTNPTYEVITGVKADTGSEKDEVCDDPPVAGLMKGGIITSVFGRYERATEILELNRLGQLNDRADPMDLAMIGSPISQTGLFTNGPGDPSVPGDILQNEVARKFFERNVSLHRLLSQQLWQGNPANNSAGGGYKEVTGLDLLITTGYVDAINNTLLPSIDSDVLDFAYQNVEQQGTNLVAALTSLYYTRRDLAERTGVMPVRWVFAMKPELFYLIAAIWPCAYLTYRCNTGLGENVTTVVNGDEQVRMRDAMRNGRYLLIDGNQIEVVLDDGIGEETNTDNGNVPSGCFSSTVYLIPMSVTGGRAVTYLEYFQYQNPSLTDAMSQMILGRIEGPWITVPKQSTWCIQWQSKIEPRVVLRTPWLAARLNHVVACPIQRTRNPFPNSPYFVDGGSVERPGPSYYTPW